MMEVILMWGMFTAKISISDRSGSSVDIPLSDYLPEYQNEH